MITQAGLHTYSINLDKFLNVAYTHTTIQKITWLNKQREITPGLVLHSISLK